jgi:hypothetical protein
MPEPQTVWMVPLRKGVAPRDVEGTLEMRDDGLRFSAAASGESIVIRYADVKRARRLYVSPVLMVEWRHEGEPVRAAFYFAPPPPLGPMDQYGLTQDPGGLRSSAGGRRPTKRRQRRENTTYLSMIGGELKPTIKEWAAETNERMRAARGSAEA